MSYGFKGKVREIITTLDRMRVGDVPGQNGAIPRDVSLRQYVRENFDQNGSPLTIEHMFADLNIDPRRTTVKQLMDDSDNAYLLPEMIREGLRRGLSIAKREQLAELAQRTASMGPVISDDGTQRWVSPDIYLDPIRLGATEATFYQDLIVSEQFVNGLTVTVPTIDLADAGLKNSGEAATIEEGTVTYGSKQVTLRKKARGIGITYEAIMFNTLSFAAIFFVDLGRMLGHSLNNMAVDTIVDGDVTGGSQAAAVVGVEDTTAGIQWYDIARVAIQFGLIGRVARQAIGNATTVLNYVDLDEFKLKQFAGSPMLSTAIKTPLTMPEALYPSTRVDDDQLVIQDPSMSLVQLTAMPLMVETEKIISKQIEKSFASIYTGFAKLARNASVILDGSIAFSGNGFPSWMEQYVED